MFFPPFFNTSYVTTKPCILFKDKQSNSISKHHMLLPNETIEYMNVPVALFQNIVCYYQTLVSLKRNLGKLHFKTSYVTTKLTVLSRSSIFQFPENRSTAGFSSKFTSRYQIFVTIPKNDNFPCKIRLFRAFTKFSVGKISIVILSNFQNTGFSQTDTFTKIRSLFPIHYI